MLNSKPFFEQEAQIGRNSTGSFWRNLISFLFAIENLQRTKKVFLQGFFLRFYGRLCKLKQKIRNAGKFIVILNKNQMEKNRDLCRLFEDVWYYNNCKNPPIHYIVFATPHKRNTFSKRASVPRWLFYYIKIQ